MEHEVGIKQMATINRGKPIEEKKLDLMTLVKK